MLVRFSLDGWAKEVLSVLAELRADSGVEFFHEKTRVIPDFASSVFSNLSIFYSFLIMKISPFRMRRLELELTGAEAKHKNALVTWSRLYDELRSRHGSVSGAMDHAKPYFDTLHKCQDGDPWNRAAIGPVITIDLLQFLLLSCATLKGFQTSLFQIC